ncbi:SUMF1/EgtB/PvdO family nonheme iron enzyme, partial [Candidatus Desantisbacteria bacterium]|nr:SUMF1/EgtB/PvdO family nonheme iron enzyme [Candidatus Desantisbacteria bacterium]
CRDTVYSYTSISGIPGLGSIAYNLSKNGYRLPTEAEWEYACRAGTTTAYYWSDTWDTATANQYSWNYSNSNRTTHAVGTKTANAWGLYDMAGNVREWCNDWRGAYSSDAQTDPSGPVGGSYRVLRGGCYGDFDYLRSACRCDYGPDFRRSGFGFRVACRP